MVFCNVDYDELIPFQLFFYNKHNKKKKFQPPEEIHVPFEVTSCSSSGNSSNDRSDNNSSESINYYLSIKKGQSKPKIKDIEISKHRRNRNRKSSSLSKKNNKQ